MFGVPSGEGGDRPAAPGVGQPAAGEDGQAGCTRPYGSYRPGEPFRDYPFAPAPSDLEEIRQQLRLDDVVE